MSLLHHSWGGHGVVLAALLPGLILLFIGVRWGNRRGKRSWSQAYRESRLPYDHRDWHGAFMRDVKNPLRGG